MTSSTPDTSTAVAAVSLDGAAVDDDFASGIVGLFIFALTCSDACPILGSRHVEDTTVNGDFTITFTIVTTANAGSSFIAVGHDELSLFVTITLTVDGE